MCKFCRGGKYQDEIGKPYCNSCPAGKYSPAIQGWFLKRAKKSGKALTGNAHCTLCPLMERMDGKGKERSQSHDESTSCSLPKPTPCPTRAPTPKPTRNHMQCPAGHFKLILDLDPTHRSVTCLPWLVLAFIYAVVVTHI